MTSHHRHIRLKAHCVFTALTIALAASTSFAGVGGEVGSGGSGGSGGSSMGSTSGIADREISRRMQRVQEAQNAINKGDKLLADGDPEGALNEYKTAIDLLPEAPATQAWRDFATAKYCDASVALAKQRAKSGRYADAKSLLNESLSRNADHLASRTLLKQLDDPERYEPALTPEHVKNVEDVNRLLAKAASYENLGDHDAANKTYLDVLRIDKYNSAARRAMEKVEQEKSIYYGSARDHTRIKMLNEVNKAWEDQVPIRFENASDLVVDTKTNNTRYLAEKMQRITFPNVQFQGASIEEAIEFLRIKSKDLDTIERDPAKRGVNLILKPGIAPSTATISLDLHDVPMVEALRYITELAGMKYKIEPFAVLVVPVSDTTTEQFTRTFKVPPDFLSLGSADAGGGGGAAAAPIDPFAPRAPGAGGAGGAPALLGGKGNALDILKAYGIPFPEGSSAVFIAATSQLIVKNTQPSLDAVENFVDTINKKVPQQIYITTKFVEVSQRNTDELGFDWLLGQFNLPGSNGAFGSGGPANGGNSLNGPQVPGNYPFLLPGIGSPAGAFPVTAGNRTGSAAITPNAIDGLLSGAKTSAAPTPGVFAISGVFTDPQFQVVIRALSQKKGVDLMTAPSVTTRSGQRANIEVVREFIYPTEFTPPQIPTNVGGGGGGGGGGIGGTTTINIPVTPTSPAAFTMRPVGVRMEVDPVIGPDGFTIDLNLAPEVTEFEGFINYGSPIQIPAVDALGNPVPIVLTENRIPQPVFGVRKITTAVTVWDGATVAMGGLIREDVQDIADKVPILGDLPIVGRLFQNKSQDHFKRNLMIFVTAKLIDPSGQPVRVAKELPRPVITDGANPILGGGLLPAIN